MQHAATSAAASEGLRWRNHRPPGGEPANLSRGPVRAVASNRLPPPRRMQFGDGPLPLSHCTNLLPRTELPVAGPPQPLLTIPTAPAAVRNQSHSGSQHNASAIPRKNCAQSARKRPHSQWFAALVLGNCTSHSHAKTHAMPLTIARSHASSHSFARKLALAIHRATFCQLRAHKRLCTKNTRTHTHTRKTHRTQTTRKPTMSSQLYIVLSAKCIYICFVWFMVYHALLSPLAAPQNSR